MFRREVDKPFGCLGFDVIATLVPVWALDPVQAQLVGFALANRFQRHVPKRHALIHLVVRPDLIRGPPLISDSRGSSLTRHNPLVTFSNNRSKPIIFRFCGVWIEATCSCWF